MYCQEVEKIDSSKFDELVKAVENKKPLRGKKSLTGDKITEILGGYYVCDASNIAYEIVVDGNTAYVGSSLILERGE